LRLVASEIIKLPEVETRQYGPGERLGGDTAARLQGLHVYIRDGAIALRVATGRSTTALELPAAMLEHTLAAHPPLALAVASRDACQHAGSLDRLAMLALRDPLRRVAHTVLLLLDRFSGAPGSAPSARLEVGQELIAAFASLSRQTTNRQLRRLARAGVAAVKRRAVDVRDLGALRGVAGGRRPLGR